MLQLHLLTFALFAPLALHLLHLLPGHRLHTGQQVNHFMLHFIQHALEQIKRFALVFLFGVLLSIGAQVNALTQVIHVGQLLFPGIVQYLQHHLLFDLGHHRPDTRTLGVVGTLHFRLEFFAQLFLV